jgi:hypothetical protein
MTKVNIAAIFALLVTCHLASADYYLSFTQIDVQPRLGRIAVHRSLVRDAKYVDWMREHQEELRADGIYVDADFGTEDVFKRTIKMDGQTIELELTSEHTKRRGQGSALPSNTLKVTIDGVLIYDGLFGYARSGNYDIPKIQIIPIDHMLRINASECVGGNQGPRWATSNDLYLFYDIEEASTVCNMEWISKKISG